MIKDDGMEKLVRGVFWFTIPSFRYPSGRTVCSWSLAGIGRSNPAGGAQIFVCCECCVFSGRRLCDGLITLPEESYRVWCVWVWSWRLVNAETLAHWGLSSHRKNIILIEELNKIIKIANEPNMAVQWAAVLVDLYSVSPEFKSRAEKNFSCFSSFLSIKHGYNAYKSVMTAFFLIVSN
jgi:hypothetical protein